MGLKTRDLITTLSVQLYDEEHANWSEPELLAWIEEAIGALADIRPDLFNRVVDAPLVAGVKQEAPPTAVRILRVLGTEGLGGVFRTVTRFNMRSMDAARPGWREDPSGVARQYALVDDDRVFYVYPPQDGGDVAQIEAVVLPEVKRPTDNGYDDHELDVDPRYRRVLVDYALYRAFLKDMNIEGAAQRAQAHYAAFMSGTGRDAIMAEQQMTNKVERR
jgi:hypothetical protein